MNINNIAGDLEGIFKEMGIDVSAEVKQHKAEEERKRQAEIQAEADRRRAEEEKRRRVEELAAKAKREAEREQIRKRENKLNPPKNRKPSPSTEPKPIKNNSDYFSLHDICCVDADGNELERYDRLYIQRNPERNEEGKCVMFTHHDAIVHYEKNGLFLPSFALTCNILVELYKNRRHLDAQLLLQQYDGRSDNIFYAQNTIVDYGTEEVIHYPSAADFGKTDAVNAGRRKTGTFVKATLQNCRLEDALKDAAHTRYVKQLTGLADPQDLVDIGKYFGKTINLRFPWEGQIGATLTDKYSAWLLTIGEIGLYCALDPIKATAEARGVRSETP